MISMTLSLSPCSEKMSIIGEETKLRKEEKLISESREIYSAIAKQFKMKSTAIKVTMEKINFFTCSTLVKNSKFHECGFSLYCTSSDRIFLM